MATISVSADTKVPSLDVSINGNMIPNVTGMYGYREVDEKGKVIAIALTIETRELLEEGLMRSITYYSRGSARANKLEAMGNAIYNDDFPDFVGEEDKTKVHEDIAQFLGRKLGSA